MATLAQSTHLDPQTRLLAGTVLGLFGRFLRVEHELAFKTAPDPVIFAFNHNNYWETLLVGSYLVTNGTGKKLAFVSDWMFGRLPFFKWFMKRIDPIYTYRKNPRFAFLNKYQQKADGQAVCQACLDRLHHRQSLGIFPEGTRNKDPHYLKRGRKGIGEITLRSGVPVLPAGIDFPGRIRDGRIPCFNPIILRFGPLLTFPEEIAACQAAARDRGLSPRERKKVQTFLSARVTHTIMMELARLSGKAYPFSAPQTPSLARQYFKNTLIRGALP